MSDFTPSPIASPPLDLDSEGFYPIPDDDAELCELVEALWATYAPSFQPIENDSQSAQKGLSNTALLSHFETESEPFGGVV